MAYEQDQISLEETTARMPCGHVIGRDCMTMFIRSLISSHKYEIKCPSTKPVEPIAKWNGNINCAEKLDFLLQNNLNNSK